MEPLILGHARVECLSLAHIAHATPSTGRGGAVATESMCVLAAVIDAIACAAKAAPREVSLGSGVAFGKVVNPREQSRGGSKIGS